MFIHSYPFIREIWIHFFSSRHRLELKKNSKNEGINIREGVMENMVAVIDPALLDANHREQRSIYQVILKPVHTLFVKTNSALKEACTRPEVFVRSNFFWPHLTNLLGEEKFSWLSSENKVADENEFSCKITNV